MESKIIEINGIEIFCTIRGSGPPMVMLHGNGEDHTIFDNAASSLESRFKLYLPDSRGHGKSAPVDEYHYEDMAEDLHKLITELELDHPIIVGFSDGAITGLIYASQYTNGLSRLFSCGANTRPEMLKGLWAWRLRHKRDLDPREKMMLTEPHITAEDLSRITVPVTVIAGSRDCIRRRDTEFISASIPDSEKMIIPGSDHCRYVYDGTIARIIEEVMDQ